jgi:hypothetical protein
MAKTTVLLGQFLEEGQIVLWAANTKECWSNLSCHLALSVLLLA